MKVALGVTDGDGSITPVSTSADGGVVRLMVVPSPSCTTIKYNRNSICNTKQHARTALAWPLTFLPQHLTPPDAVSAHVCCNPQTIAATLVSTSADGVFRAVLVPSPSCTHHSLPQFNEQAHSTNMQSTCLAIGIITPTSYTA